MKCNIKNRPLTEEQSKDLEERNIKSNRVYLNYAHRALMVSVRKNAGFGEERFKRLNNNSYELGQEYIERYSSGMEMSDKEYAVDSYYALRRDLLYIGWDPDVELWPTNPFTERDFPSDGHGVSANQRKKREAFLWYANSMSFYVREMLCLAAKDLHDTNGFGAKRLNPVFHPVRDRFLALMRLYLAMDKEAVFRELRKVLKEFNDLGIFKTEYEL